MRLIPALITHNSVITKTVMATLTVEKAITGMVVMDATMTAYEEKIDSRFRTFDRDGDGILSEADFVLMAEDVLAKFGESQSGEKGQALLDGARQFWRGLADAVDADDEAEYERLLAALGATANAHRTAAGTEHNSDGRISHEQVVANTVAFYTSESPAHIDDLFQPEARG
jgi:hypothetical protein